MGEFTRLRARLEQQSRVQWTGRTGDGLLLVRHSGGPGRDCQLQETSQVSFVSWGIEEGPVSYHPMIVEVSEVRSVVSIS